MNDLEPIIRKIYVIRGQRVMLDKDLAELYEVTTGNLNKAVKRNIRRFPPDFMFQLTKEEWDSLRFQIGIMNTPERPEIGYVAVQKQREKSQIYPPQLTKLNKNNSILGKATPALFHTASRRMSRAFDVRRNCFRSAELKRASLCSHLTAAFYCLCLIVSTFILGSCQQEETHISGMQQLYQESQHLNQASLDSIDSFTTKLGGYINAHPSVLEDELYEPLINNINLSLAPYGYYVKVTAVSAGVKINTDWEGFKFYSYDKDGNLTLDSVYTKEQLDSLGINKGVIDLREEWLNSQGKDS